MVSCNNLSLSSGQTPYIAANATTNSYSVTSFAQNGIIYVGSGCSGSVAPDGYYFNGTNWALVWGGSGVISLIGLPTFTDYRFIICGGSSENILSASTDSLVVGNTYLIETYDSYYGFTQICVTIIEDSLSYASVVLQSKPSQLTDNCGACNNRISCTVGYSNPGEYVYYYDCCGYYSAYTYTNSSASFSFNPSLSYSLNIIIIPTAGFNPCVSANPTPTPTQTPSQTPTQTITPTNTKTPTPTPSFTPEPPPPPVYVYDNNCSVIVSFPMGLKCVTTNTTSQTANNGSITVVVTGGTTPYTYYWNTGARTNTINNLLPGSYTCTVVDYYGDYTGTTTCTVNAPELECKLIGSVNQMLITTTPTPTLTQTPTITPSITPTLTQTPTNTTTQTPTVTRPLKSFVIKAFGLNALRFGTWTNTTNSTVVNWGDSSTDTYPSGTLTNTVEHIYSTPYTGDITFSSVDLSTITNITITNTITGTTSSGVTFTTSEMSKLSGLTTLEFGTTADPDALNSGNAYVSGITSQLPRTLTTFRTNKNNLSGNVSELPTGLTNTFILGTNTLSGDTTGLPKPANASLIAIGGDNTISGDVAGLPQNSLFKTLSITGYNTLSGNTSDIPTGLTFCIIWGYNTITGDIADTPRTITSTLSIEGNNTITGDTTGLPSGASGISIRGNGSIRGLINNISNSVKILYLYGTSGISGLTSDFTSDMTEISLLGAYNAISGDTSYLSTMTSLRVFQISGGTSPISGDISNIPVSMRNLALYEGNTISGSTASITSKTALRTISLFGNNTVDGSLSDFPTNFLSSISFGGNNTITGYTSPHNWYSNMSDVRVTNDISTYGFSATTIDNILIDLTGKTWVNSKLISLEYEGTTPPTAAGQAAFNSLTGSGITITFVS